MALIIGSWQSEQDGCNPNETHGLQLSFSKEPIGCLRCLSTNVPAVRFPEF